MFQIKNLVLSCGLLLAICWRAAEAAEVTTTICPPTAPPGSDDDSGRDGDLCDNFQALRELIDRDALVNLTLAHYQCDAKFRKAVCYYNTSRFNLVIEQLQQSASFQTLLEDLRELGVNTSAINQIVDIFQCFSLPLPLNRNGTCDCKAVRGHTFLEDVLAIMPKQRVHAFTRNARVYNTNFGLFSDALTSGEFQSRLRSTLVSD